VESGFFSVLDPWSTQARHDSHVRSVLPPGASASDHNLWTGAPAGFFLASFRPRFRSDWAGCRKRPSGGAAPVRRYLGAYSHRIAISVRLVILAEGMVTLGGPDPAHKKRHSAASHFGTGMLPTQAEPAILAGNGPPPASGLSWRVPKPALSP
jgi:hypothetical protein